MVRRTADGSSLVPAQPPRDGWVEMLEAQFDYVYWTVRRLGAGPSDAEDVAQEVFLVLWRRRGAFDPARPLRPWIAGIAAHVIREHRRRIRRELAGGLVDAADETRSPENHLASAQARRLVLEALASVPPKQRVVLVMHELDEIPMREISEALGEPVFTLYSRLQRGRVAFARAVRRAEATASWRRSISPAALLAANRAVRQAPAGARRRALERVRSWMTGGAWDVLDASPSRAPAGGSAVVLGLVGVLLAVVLAFAVRGRAAERTSAPATALAGHWSFEDSVGSVLARDGSGAGNDCLLRRLDPQTVWRPGARGQALGLTGAGWLACPVKGALGTIDDEVTIAVWVTDGKVLPRYHAVVSRQLGSGRQDQFMFGFGDGALLFASHVWKGRVASPLPPVRGPWYHVAVTRRSDGLAILYVDGREVDRGMTGQASLPREDTPLIIGAAMNTPDPGRAEARFDGGVDDLRIYTRALSPAEIAKLAARD